MVWLERLGSFDDDRVERSGKFVFQRSGKFDDDRVERSGKLKFVILISALIFFNFCFNLLF